ncbi:hypothetical protein UFOVP144_49 [uncultured Caudovirales phage]|uniref:Uncharacterized protein n=1 Tax=uncultured Caudovirales phage TaxID=2100421 RepID=A0A6J7XM21_9CAUD|nr:hypothetical protein UFOVP144_49 [uncultured Caudovirales phage]
MENNQADIGTAENNSEAQSNATSSSILNEESLAAKLRETLFADDEQAAEPQAVSEGEDQTEVKDDQTDEEAPSAESETDIPQAEDGEEVHSQEADEELEDGSLSKGVQKRIDKLTAKRKQAEEQSEELRKEVEALKQQISESQQQSDKNNSVNNADNPFSSLKSVAEVEKEIEQARWLRYKCMENPDGFVLGESEYGPEDVRRMLVNSTKAIEDHLPKQMQRIDAESKIKPIAESTYPWWKQTQSSEYQMAQQVLRAFPQLKNFPDWQMFVGDYVRGAKAREASVAKPNQSKKVPVQAIRPTATPARSNPTEARAKQAEGRFAKSTSADDLAKVLLAKGFI